MLSNRVTVQKFLYITYIFIFGVIAWGGALIGVFPLFKRTFFLWAFLITAVVIIFMMAEKLAGNVKTDNVWIIWFLVGIAMRIIYYFLVQTVQTSDFYQPTAFYLHLDKIGGYSEYNTIYRELDEYQVYYSLYPAWATYMFIVHGLYRIFGVHTSLLVAVNIILSGMMIWIYARLLDKAGIDTKTKNIIIALLACFPQMVMWDAVASPDHFAVLLLALLVYVWYKSLTSEKVMLYVLAEAACISMVGLFKPIVPLLIVLLICADIFMALFTFKTAAKKLVAKNLFMVVLTISVTGTVNYGTKALLEDYIKTDVQQATSFYFLWGYSVDNNGNWDSHAADDTINEAFAQAEYMSDVVAYTDKAAEVTLKKNISLLPKILWQKFRLLFSSDHWSFYWGLTNNNNSRSLWLNKYYYVFGGVQTVLNSLSLLFIPFSLLRKRRLSIFMSLGWVGYICFLVLAGIQTRYRYIMLPFQLVLTGIGYMELKGLFYEKYKR